MAGAIVLGIVGNALYDAIKDQWSTGPTVLYAVVAAATTLLLGVVLRSVSRYPSVLAVERPFGPSSSSRFLNSWLGALLLRMTLGIVTTLAWARPIFAARKFSPFRLLPSMTNYEVGTMVSFALVAIVFTRKQVEWLALVLFATGFATSAAVAVAVLSIDGETHGVIATLTSYIWICISLTTGALLLLAAGLPSAIRVMLQQR